MSPDIQRILLLSDQLLNLSEKESHDEIDAMAALALALLCLARATGADDRAIDSLITCLRHDLQSMPDVGHELTRAGVVEPMASPIPGVEMYTFKG